MAGSGRTDKEAALRALTPSRKVPDMLGPNEAARIPKDEPGLGTAPGSSPDQTEGLTPRPGPTSPFSLLSCPSCQWFILNMDNMARPHMAGPGRGKRLIFWSNSNLGEEVLLGILMKGGDSSLGTKPGINSDLIFFPVTQAAVIGDANVLLQLWDL